MTSLISSFCSRSNWHALGISILPIVADQLEQRVFSKKCSPHHLETASLVTGSVVCLLISRVLPPSIKLGAPILYLAYKAAQSYLNRQPPPDKGPKPSHRSSLNLFSTVPYHIDLAAFTTAPAAAVAKEPESKKEPTQANEGSAGASMTTKPPAVVPIAAASSSSVALSPEETAARKEAADRMNAAVETERLATLRFQDILKPFEKSEIMSLKIQVKPLPNAAPVAGKKAVKAKEVKAQIRFGSTHVFTLGKTQVEALNQEGCAVTEKTLFFWIDIAGKDKEGAYINFIPLMMLDDLRPTTKEFSLCLIEKDHQLVFPFNEKQIVRLKAFAQTIRACRKVEVIHGGVVQPFAKPAASTNDNIGGLLSNDIAGVNHARCYLVPFMKKI